MDRKKKAGVLAALSLATALGGAQPLYAHSTKINSTPIRKVIPNSIEAAWDCFWGEFCSNKDVAHVQRHTTQKTTHTTKRTTHHATHKTQTAVSHSTPKPAQDLNKFYYSVGKVENWCLPNVQPNHDYAQILSSRTGPLQTAAGYRTVLAKRSDTPQAIWEIAKDGTIWGYEIRSLPKSSDGMYHMNIPLDELLLDKNNNVKAKRGFIFDLAAPDCYTQPCNPCDQPEGPVSGKTPKERTPRVAETPLNAGPWNFTIGAGPFSNTLETFTKQTVRGQTKLIPYEEIFDGNKLHAQAKYATDNTQLLLQGASSKGSSVVSSDGQYCGTSDVSAYSLGGEFKQGFSHFVIRPQVTVGGEYKVVDFKDGYGPFASATSMRNTNSETYLLGGLRIGNLNSSYLDVNAGPLRQTMEFHRYGNVASDRRGDGVTEDMLLFTASGQGYAINNHLRGFFDVKYMQPQKSRATNPAEEITDAKAHNYRVGGEWIFHPQSKNPFGIGIEKQYAQEDSTIGGVPFHNTGDAWLLNFHFRR